MSGPDANGWYRIDGDNPPPEYEPVDVWWQQGDEGYRVPDCRQRISGPGWIDDFGNIHSGEFITHWQPLPAPPVTEGE